VSKVGLLATHSDWRLYSQNAGAANAVLVHNEIGYTVKSAY